MSPKLRPQHGGEVPSAAMSLASSLEERINAGIYAVGSQMPKVDYLEATERHARCTVLQALRRMGSRNMIHKQRHRWIVGPAPSTVRSGRLARSAQSVVIINIGRSEDWFTLFENHFSASFMTPFAQELVNHRFLLTPSVRAVSTETAPAGVPTGIAEVLSAAKALGDRFAGIIFWSANPHEQRVDRWIEAAAVLGKPVVFIDSTGKADGFTRAALGLGREYIRMHLDEEDMIRTALSELSAHGHRTVAVHNWRQTDWAVRRIEQIRTIARAERPAMSIAVGPESEPQWLISNWSGMREFVDAVAALEGISPPSGDGEGPVDAALRAAIVAHSHSLTSLLVDSGSTAVMALADRLAREYHSWARALGIVLPRDLSLISFDNTPESIFFPVSTIDPGLGRLGYLAAHLFVGDISVRADRQGNIPTRCSVVDRGSIGEPSPRSLRNALRRAGVR